MIEILFQALFLGLIAGFIPGPILTLIINDTLHNGFKGGVKTSTGAIIAECVLVIFIITIFSFLETFPFILTIVHTLGAFLLFWIAYKIYKNAKNPETNHQITSYKLIFLLTFLNGIAYLFWITVCLPLALELNQIIEFGKFIYILFFEIGWTSAVLLLVLITNFLRKKITEKDYLIYVFKGISILLFLFGIKLLYTGLIEIF